jgi:formylglycine-generating enzyme required for sulfatase activity
VTALGLLVAGVVVVCSGMLAKQHPTISAWLAQRESTHETKAEVKATEHDVGAVRPAPLDCTGVDGLSAADVRRAQEAWAKYLGREVEETVEIAEGVQMTFVLMPPGKFLMGSPKDEKDRRDDETLHEVTLTEPFDLGQTEVTQAQYQALTGKNPSWFSADGGLKEKVKGMDTSRFPVEIVSWYEARDYGEQLTKKTGDKHVYRLPTEAEWEYACRGGRSSAKPFGIGDGTSLSSDQTNFNGGHPYGGAAKGKDLGRTCLVGSYPANALGLSDMHGNVVEWCADWLGPYPQGPVTNPAGPSEGSARVYRGGCWNFRAAVCRAAIRHGGAPVLRHEDLGFRLARSVPSGGK